MQNNKFPLKNIRLKALKPADNEEVNFLCEILKLPKDLTVKAKKSCKLRTQAMIHHLAIFKNWSMRESSFKQIKRSKLNH